MSLLGLDVLLDCFSRNVPGCTDVVTARPHTRQPASNPREFLSQNMSGVTVNSVHNLVGRNRWRKTVEKVNVIGLDCQIEYFALKLLRLFANPLFKSSGSILSKNSPPVLRTPNEVVIDVVGCMSRTFAVHTLNIAHMFEFAIAGEPGCRPARIPSPLKRGDPCGRFYGNHL